MPRIRNHDFIFRTNLAECGFDICHAFRPEWYNTLITKEGVNLKPLPCFSENHQNRVRAAYLIGNTRVLWPKFLDWLRERQPTLPQDPIDSYTNTHITQAVGYSLSQDELTSSQEEKDTQSKRHDIFWADGRCTLADPFLVSLQRVAHCSGLAYTDPTTKLSIHPIYGTWISYRAVVLFYDNGPAFPMTNDGTISPPHYDDPPPQIIPYEFSSDETEAAEMSFQRAMYGSSTGSTLGNGKDEKNDKLCKLLHHGGAGIEDVYLDWVALRDTINVGKEEYRFSQDQIKYHYTKDQNVLIQALSKKDPTESKSEINTNAN